MCITVFPECGNIPPLPITHIAVARRLDDLLVAMTDADEQADRSLSFDSQAAAVGVGGAIGAIGITGAVRVIDGVGREP